MSDIILFDLNRPEETKFDDAFVGAFDDIPVSMQPYIFYKTERPYEMNVCNVLYLDEYSDDESDGDLGEVHEDSGEDSGDRMHEDSGGDSGGDSGEDFDDESSLDSRCLFTSFNDGLIEYDAYEHATRYVDVVYYTKSTNTTIGELIWNMVIEACELYPKNALDLVAHAYKFHSNCKDMIDYLVVYIRQVYGQIFVIGNQDLYSDPVNRTVSICGTVGDVSRTNSANVVSAGVAGAVSIFDTVFEDDIDQPIAQRFSGLHDVFRGAHDYDNWDMVDVDDASDIDMSD